MLRIVLIFSSIFLVSSPIFGAKMKSPKILATKVNIFTPQIKSLIAKRKGFCWTGSLALSRDDAWRCMVGSNIFDPCFTINKSQIVVCDVDPAKNKEGFPLKLARLLPEKSKNKKKENDAWIIKLSDGEVCYPYTGTMPIFSHNSKTIALRYGCIGGSGENESGLLHESVVPGKVWRVKKVAYKNEGKKYKIVKIQDVSIDEIWK